MALTLLCVCVCVCVLMRAVPTQVGGLIELFKAVDGGAYGYHADDFTEITGKPATTIQQYIASVAKYGFA